MLIAQAESEDEEQEAAIRSLRASKSGGGDVKKTELAAEDNGGGGRVAAAAARRMRRAQHQQTHSRGSSGASVKFVAGGNCSETGSSVDGASCSGGGHQRTLSGASSSAASSSGGASSNVEEDADGEARVIILSPSPVGDDEEEESDRKTLDEEGKLEEEIARRLNPDPKDSSDCPSVAMVNGSDGNKRGGYGSIRSSATSTPLKAVSRNAKASPLEPSGEGGGGENQRVEASERLLSPSEAQGGGGDQAESNATSNHMVRSDSCSSDDEMGANSSGYMRHKPRKRLRHGEVHLEVEEDEVDNGGRGGCEQEDKDIPKEPFKTLVAFLFFFFGAVATTTSLALAHERVPAEKPLPDVFLDNVHYQEWGLDVSEVTIMAASISTFALCLFHGSRFVVLRRVFFLGGLHYLYRAITMYVTVLPKPDTHYTCVPKAQNLTFVLVAQRVVKLLSGVGLTINGEHVYCGDYIYSGHTMTLVMTYLIVKEYSPKRWYLLHWLSWSLSAFGIAVLLLARGHYSIDVVIAYWITTRLWWIYHTMANNPTLIAHENSENFLNRFWWWPIFSYLEGNVGRPLPRTYNWPLPKPVVVKSRIYLERLRANLRRQSHSERDGSSEPALAEQQQQQP